MIRKHSNWFINKNKRQMQKEDSSYLNKLKMKAKRLFLYNHVISFSFVCKGF